LIRFSNRIFRLSAAAAHPGSTGKIFLVDAYKKQEKQGQPSSFDWHMAAENNYSMIVRQSSRHSDVNILTFLNLEAGRSA
jgi:phosphoribosylanthranilate isomerase